MSASACLRYYPKGLPSGNFYVIHLPRNFVFDQQPPRLKFSLILLFSFACRKIQGLIGDFLSLSQIANTDKNCSFQLFKEHSFQSGYGFAVRKPSPWLQEISSSVLTHQENGTVQSIVNRWFPKSICGRKMPRKLESGAFAGLFWTVFAVSVFALLALLAEFFILVALVKFGKKLGPLGRFLKRFLLNVKREEEEEEDQASVQCEPPPTGGWM